MKRWMILIIFLLMAAVCLFVNAITGFFIFVILAFFIEIAFWIGAFSMFDKDIDKNNHE